jgi:3-hydroxyisobutyrate dehydrogenase-like beta-hydroxyacid dehydrogenase
MHRRHVGIIGVGLMGAALAQRLAAAGFGFAGYDVDAAKTAQIAELGGEAARSIAEIARACDPIVLAVFNTDQVEEVVEKHLLPALGEESNRIVLCASTCDPDRIAALGVRVAVRGLRFLETPVSGTSAQVARGEGLGLIGGDPAIAAEIDPVLRALFPSYCLIGKVGDGGRAKLAVNLILGLNRLALAEGLAFAERMGLDPAAFLDVARRSAAYSQIMDVKGGRMIDRAFEPEGRARQTLKDAQLMLHQARVVGQELPLLKVHAEVLDACLRAGEGDLDNSVVIEEMRRRRNSSRG